MIHELKTWTKYFQPLIDGKKRFEIRKNDRNFQEGDILVLKEYILEQGKYTGRVKRMKIDYILSDYPAVDYRFVVMSLSEVNDG